MFCTQCGQEVPDGSVTCSNCGNSLVETMSKLEADETPQSDEQRKVYRKRAWICLFGPIGFFIFLVLFWGIANLFGSASGPGIGRSPVVDGLNTMISLLMILPFIAFPIGIGFAIFYFIRSKK